MKKIIVASNNNNKIKEIKEIMKDLPFEIVSLSEMGIDVEVEEDKDTFMDNAYKKAYEIYKISGGEMVMSDDSGLMVDALDGKPGVFSARFAGEHGNSKKNNEKLLQMLKPIKLEDRTAKFVCAIVLIIDSNKAIKVQGEVNGYIIEEEKGNEGFGYDPIFYVPEFKKTFAEISSEQKNSISHRGNALKKLLKSMKEEIKIY